MQPRIYDNCQLFAFDREKLQFELLDPKLVGVRYWQGFHDYYLLAGGGERRLLIVQAINIKKAAAKMITLLNIYKQHGI